MGGTGDMVERVLAKYQHDPNSLGMFGTQTGQVLTGTNVYLAPGYAYTGMERVQRRQTRVEIDLNVRVRGNGTFVGFDDVSGPVAVGESVEVHESESGVAGEGRVTEIDGDRELIFLSVDWASLKEEAATSGRESFQTAATGSEWPLISTDNSWTVNSLAVLETSAAATRLVFLDAVSPTHATPHEPWLDLIPRPCLAGIAGGNGTVYVTAPLNDTAYLLNSLAQPYADRWQVNVNFGTATSVAA
jgi:hypothetical protein